jgi:hypothetical protein
MIKQDKKQMIETIRKLMALGQSPEENEAIAAIAKAQELMSKFNISLTETEIKQEVNQDVRQETFATKGYFSSWEKNLFYGLGKNYDCEGFFKKVENTRTISVVFMGLDSDIEILDFTLGYLMQAIDGLNTKFVLGMRGAELKRSEKLNKKNSYATGIVRNLLDRLAEIREKAQAKTGALISAKDAKVKDYQKAQGMKFKRHTSTTSFSHDNEAYLQGKEDGENIRFTKAVKTTKAKTMPKVQKALAG